MQNFRTTVQPQSVFRGMKNELPIDSTQRKIIQPVLTPSTRTAAAKLTLLETSVLASSRLINFSE